MLPRRLVAVAAAAAAAVPRRPTPSDPLLVLLRHSSSEFSSRPGPPPLPPAQQREFDELVRRVQAPASRPAEGVHVQTQSLDELVMHPDFRAKPKPAFQGNVNPVTGEVGGPKNEPLAHGDWSYGGKCTDF